jgi:hypothetical protein
MSLVTSVKQNRTLTGRSPLTAVADVIKTSVVKGHWPKHIRSKHCALITGQCVMDVGKMHSVIIIRSPNHVSDIRSSQYESMRLLFIAPKPKS